MNSEKGSTLIVSLVLLTLITLVTMYLLEGSTLQSKMIVNTLTSSIAYQDCRNEQEAHVRKYNTDRTDLIVSMTAATKPASLTKPITTAYDPSGDISIAKSTITVDWRFIQNSPGSRGGYDIDSESQSQALIFENDCTAVKTPSSNSQVLGAVVDGLQQAGVTD